MPATSEQTTSISISASGRKIGFLNLGFLFSLLGALQLLAVVLGLLVTILLGYCMSGTSKTGNYAAMGGFTFYSIILLVSFWCLLTTGFIYISCAVSIVSATLLPKTIFFLLYNAMAALFYLLCSITCLGEASPLQFTWDDKDVKSIVIAAAVMGIAAGAVYVLITIVGLFMFKKGGVSSPS